MPQQFRFKVTDSYTNEEQWVFANSADENEGMIAFIKKQIDLQNEDFEGISHDDNEETWWDARGKVIETSSLGRGLSEFYANDNNFKIERA